MLFTADPQVENYARIFTTIPFGRSLANGLIVSVAATLLQLITC